VDSTSWYGVGGRPAENLTSCDIGQPTAPKHNNCRRLTTPLRRFASRGLYRTQGPPLRSGPWVRCQEFLSKTIDNTAIGHRSSHQRSTRSSSSQRVKNSNQWSARATGPQKWPTGATSLSGGPTAHFLTPSGSTGRIGAATPPVPNRRCDYFLRKRPVLRPATHVGSGCRFNDRADLGRPQ